MLPAMCCLLAASKVEGSSRHAGVMRATPHAHRRLQWPYSERGSAAGEADRSRTLSAEGDTPAVRGIEYIDKSFVRVGMTMSL